VPELILTRRLDKYGSYEELARCEVQQRDYRITAVARPHSPVLVVAPHGGMIEAGTSEIAACIAGDEYSLFGFEGHKPHGSNRDLHITSHRFDHPDCLAMAGRCDIVLCIHGCIGVSQIHVGGRDRELSARLAHELAGAGFAVEAQSAKYPGLHPRNICNRGSQQKGSQLEITYDLRVGTSRAAIVRAARAAIAAHLTSASCDGQPTTRLADRCAKLDVVEPSGKAQLAPSPPVRRSA
jgi:phage replication-related protein YjqB (UPF0714/DUF867 family)